MTANTATHGPAAPRMRWGGVNPLRGVRIFIGLVFRPRFMIAFAWWLIVGLRAGKEWYDIWPTDALRALNAAPGNTAPLLSLWFATIVISFAFARLVAPGMRASLSTPSAWLLPGVRESAVRGTIALAALIALVHAVMIARATGSLWPHGALWGSVSLLVFSAGLCMTTSRFSFVKPREDITVIATFFGLVYVAALHPDLIFAIAVNLPFVFAAGSVALAIYMLRGEFSHDVWRVRTDKALGENWEKENPGEDIDYDREKKRKKADDAADKATRADSHTAGPVVAQCGASNVDALEYPSLNRLVQRVRQIVAVALQDASGQPMSKWLIAFLMIGMGAFCIIGQARARASGVVLDGMFLALMSTALISATPLERPLPRVMSRADKAAMIFWSTITRMLLLLGAMLLAIYAARLVIAAFGLVPAAQPRPGRAPNTTITLGMVALLIMSLMPLSYMLRMALRGRPKKWLSESQRQTVELFISLPVAWIMIGPIIEWNSMRAWAGDFVLALIVSAIAAGTHLTYRAVLQRRYTKLDLSDGGESA